MSSVVVPQQPLSGSSVVFSGSKVIGSVVVDEISLSHPPPECEADRGSDCGAVDCAVHESGLDEEHKAEVLLMGTVHEKLEWFKGQRTMMFALEIEYLAGMLAKVKFGGDRKWLLKKIEEVSKMLAENE